MALALVAGVSAVYGVSAAGEALTSGAVIQKDVLSTAECVPMRPPWARWIPAEATQLAELALEQQALVGLAILVHRQPAALRRSAVINLLARWRSTQLEATAPEAPESDRVNSLPRRFSVSRPGSPTYQQIRGSRMPKPAASNGEDALPARVGIKPIIGSPGYVEGAPNVRELAIAASQPDVQRGSAGSDPDRVIDIDGGSIMAAEVATELGGLFHLIYLAQRLGLYSDFTAPGQRGIALGVWDFLTLIGRRLLGGAGQPRDPIWRLLADLQGRRYEAPAGLGFRPRVWRVPPEWLEPFPSESPWRYRISGHRLVLRHPYNFVVGDGRLDLSRELRRYGVARAVPDRSRPLDQALNSRDRWVAHMAGYLRCRLAVALGVTPARATRLVLCRAARVSVTASRVDVISELAHLPIEVRLAAVDRDPGFVPAAGRSLYFHFR